MKKLIIYSLLLFCISPYITAQRQAVSQVKNNEVKIMSFNICSQRIFDTKWNRFINILNNMDIDVVGIQEVDSLWYYSSDRVCVDLMDILANGTGLNSYFYAASYQNDYFHGASGEGVLSRENAISNWGKKLPDPPLYNFENWGPLQVCEYDNYVLFNTHMLAEHYLPEHDTVRIAQSQAISELAKQYNKPVFLVGDLNDWHGSRSSGRAIDEFDKEWQIISDSTQHTFIDDYDNRTLDYIYGFMNKDQNGNPRYHYTIINREVLDAPKISDFHLPVYAHVVFNNVAPATVTGRNIPLTTTQNLNSDLIIHSYLDIASTGDLIMDEKTSIIIESGARLTVNGGQIHNANIIVKDGGTLIIQNNGTIYLNYDDDITITKGAVFDLQLGQIVRQ